MAGKTRFHSAQTLANSDILAFCNCVRNVEIFVGTINNFALEDPNDYFNTAQCAQ